MSRLYKGKRPKLPPVSEEMRRTFAMLAGEVGTWPGVSMKLMFGFRAVYRAKNRRLKLAPPSILGTVKWFVDCT